MTYNLPLLRKERDWVAEQIALPFAESQLEMRYWFVSDTSQIYELQEKTCGTTYCVAGHIAETTPGAEWTEFGATFNGEPINLTRWAGEQLGLNYDQRFDLFYASNDDVLDLLDEYIALAEAEERDAA